ncbi:MAG: hypothetical protein H6707_15955 [Deltaproteobacteria bacterium]|nr:hypothetical protein [Deltaproteobacteria bacterium]
MLAWSGRWGRLAGLLVLLVQIGCSGDVTPTFIGVSTDGGVSSDAGVTLDRGLLLNDGPPSFGDGPPCAQVEGEATAQGGGVDIIWFIDTSGSMAVETAWVRTNLNAFAAFIGKQNIDYRVVLIADKSVCVPEPLAGPNCADGPRFKHVKQTVGSRDGLQKLISTYPLYQAFLGPTASKNFIAVTDDESSITAATFKTQLAALTNPGFADGFTFHSIVAYGNVAIKGCNTGARIGQAYLDLTAETKGEKFQVCLQDWTSLFPTLANSVAATATLPCEYKIPVPESRKINYGDIRVKHTRGSTTVEIPKLANEAACSGSDGWFFDNDAAPTAVRLCPLSCGTIAGAKVTIDFGCLFQVK